MKMIRGLYNILCSLIAFIVLSSCVSPLEEQLRDVSPLCVTHPDSAMSILQTIQPDILHANNIEKALYDINMEAAYYIKHRVPTVTADSTLAYINDSYGKELFLMKRILCAIHMFKSHKIEESFACFESCSRDLDADVHPYWKCVVDDYLAIIYLNSRVMDKSKEHFYRVLHRAEEMGDVKVIANAYSHLSVYYSEVNKLDSAFLYATKVLYNEDVLDSLMLAVAYHNLASIQVDLARFDNSEIRHFLKQSKEFRRRYRNSPVTDALLAQSYYLCNGIDSAYIYHRKVVESNNDVAHLVLYKFLADYYNKQAQVDSAYKYLKLYETRNAEFSAKRKTQSILNIYHQQKHEYSEQQSSRIRIYIIIGALFLTVCIVVILSLRHHRQNLKAKTKLVEHESQISKLSQQKNQLLARVNYQEKIITEAAEEKQLVEEELTTAQNTLLEATRKIESYSATISKKNSMLARANREKEKAECNAMDQSEIVIQKFLDKSVTNSEKMNKTQMEFIIEAYASSHPTRKSFVRQLIKHAKELSPTSTIICILYHEQFLDEEIICKLHYEPRNYRMAKSRARAAIDRGVAENPVPIKELLSRFDYKKSTK